MPKRTRRAFTDTTAQREELERLRKRVKTLEMIRLVLQGASLQSFSIAVANAMLGVPYRVGV